MSELPIVCTLQPGELNTRTAQLLPGLARAATTVVAIADGYRFEFEAGSAILNAIAAAIDAERPMLSVPSFPTDGGAGRRTRDIGGVRSGGFA